MNFATELARALVRGVVLGLAAGAGSKRCAQCWKPKPLTTFVSRFGRVVNMCNACRDRYSNWHSKTDAERARARAKVRRTGTGYTVHLTPRSKNRKTGPIPVSVTDMKSCPTSCPHMDAGCYAGYGKAGWLWSTVAERGIPWRLFCLMISELPKGTLWRHNEAGDLPGVGDALDLDALDMLVSANQGRRGFCFSHKPLREPKERRAVARAVRKGFMINLSADNLAHADELADLGIAPVAVILPSETAAATRTPAGRKVVVCPAVTSGLTCATCGLCAKDRKALVGFPAHGQAKRLVSLRASRNGASLSG